MKFELKKDMYLKKRGGHARFINLYCSKCGKHLLLYQKDGPKHGFVKRLYLDRIFAPNKLSSLQKLPGRTRIRDIPDLACKSCKAVIGIPMRYEKENRRAFFLKEGSFIKRESKGVYKGKR